MQILKTSDCINSVNFKEFGNTVGKLTVVFITSSTNLMDMWGKKERMIVSKEVVPNTQLRSLSSAWTWLWPLPHTQCPVYAFEIKDTILSDYFPGTRISTEAKKKKKVFPKIYAAMTSKHSTLLILLLLFPQE